MSASTRISRALSCVLFLAIPTLRGTVPAVAQASLRAMPAPAVSWVSNGKFSANGNSLIQLSGFAGPVAVAGGRWASIVQSTGGLLQAVRRGLGNTQLDSYNGNFGVSGSTSYRAYFAMSTASQSNGTNGAVASPLLSNSNGNTLVNPAAAATLAVTADQAYSPNSDGTVSPLGHPAAFTVLSIFDNDPAFPGSTGSHDSIWVGDVHESIATARALRDAYLAQGKRILFIGGHPRGVGFNSDELVTISSAIGTVQKSGTLFRAMLEDAVSGGQGLYVTATTGSAVTVGQQLTEVAFGSTLATGQYYVDTSGTSTAGRITTFAADAITQVSASYTYNGGARTGGAITYYQDLVGWVKSADANYVGVASGTSFGPGLLYGQTNVFYVDTFAPMLDSATQLNKPLTSIDGLHLAAYGEELETAAVAAANTAQGITAGAPVPFKNSAGHSYTFATTSGATLTYSGALPTAMRGAASKGMWVVVGARVLADPTGSGTLLSSDASTGSVNYTTGAVSITLASVVPTGFGVLATQDPTNIVTNAGLDYGQGAGTVNTTGSSVSATVPRDWTLASSANSLATGSGNTFVMTIAAGTDSAGNPAIEVSGSGFLNSLSVKYDLTEQLKQVAEKVFGANFVRGGVHVEVRPGSDGHLRGLALPGAYIELRSATAVNVAGQTNQATVFHVQDMNPATYGYGVLNDSCIPAGGVISYDSVTPEIPLLFIPDDTTGDTIALEWTAVGYQPQSWDIRFSLPSTRTLN